MKIILPEPIDSLIRGLEPKTITNFFGGPGTGKTNFCLLATLWCIKNNGSVTFIDTEGGFSLERLKQLTPDYKSVLEKITLVEPRDFKEQGKVIRSLNERNHNLIIVDSLSALYRLEFAEKSQTKETNAQILEANRELSKQLSVLSNLARKKEIPIIITCHAFKGWDTGDKEVVGGDAVKYWSKVMVFLEKTGRMSERRATIVKHRYISEGRSTRFMIVEEGIKPAGFRLF